MDYLQVNKEEDAISRCSTKSEGKTYEYTLKSHIMPNIICVRGQDFLVNIRREIRGNWRN